MWPKGSNTDFFSPKASKEFSAKANQKDLDYKLAGRKKDEYRKRALDHLKWGDEEKYDELNKTAEFWKQKEDEFLDKSIELRKAGIELDPVEQYYRSAGEVQARMAQRQLEVDPIKTFPGHLDYEVRVDEDKIIRNPLESETNRYDPEYLKKQYPGHDFSYEKAVPNLMDTKLVGLGNAISDGYLTVYYPHLLDHTLLSSIHQAYLHR